MKLLDDTSPEARQVLIRGYRDMPFARRWQIMEDAYRTARVLHEMGFRQRNENATAAMIESDWAEHALGPLAKACGRVEEAQNVDPQSLINLPIVMEVLGRFRQLGIPCALGGSLASSIHGVPRYTLDADLTSAPFPGREADFVATFGSEYYVSKASVEQANRERSTFNIIQTFANFKVDVFIQKTRPFDAFLLARKQSVPRPGAPGELLDVLSPEDVILHKLEWFRMGGETSDRQWSDILGILQVQAGKLDKAYLDYWAEDLRVADLLEKVRQQV